MIFLSDLTAILFFTLTASILALPTSSVSPGCTNAVFNPTFSTGSLDPWLDFVTGSWAARGITTTSSGSHVYTARSNSSVVTATLSLSQSNVKLVAGTTVECYTWVHTERATGETRVEVFLDAMPCGRLVALEPESGWTKVEGTVVVGEGDLHVQHTISVSVQGDGVMGASGWSVDVGEVGVGEGC
ncbi:hypothetical protein GMOD_00000319 [Pyrenophora seminiperda CCB06]|uniref:Uncharacterized protein n=1 Tax=Pyrenophora seminiperda CCB06 TaxID=1302712 RepID=A0A3M7M772_9PLEO|nr:hypothetical protein GMOD_00000319 [Pyrenophora seminiperda CCB06]